MSPTAFHTTVVAVAHRDPKLQHEREPAVLSDTDSASGDSAVLSDSEESHFSKARSLAAPSAAAYANVERHEQFTTGAQAVVHVAGHVADNVFQYPLLGDVNDTSEELRARIVTLEVRSGAGAVVQGALSAGSTAAVLAPSQVLPAFLPSLFQIAENNQPAVFHVQCESVRRDLAVSSTYEALYALQHAGAVLLNSSTAQEMHDMALVAHVVALRLNKLVVHFYDGARVAREQTKLHVLSPEALRAIATAEANAVGGRPANGTAEQVQAALNDLFHVFHKQYHVFEYHGSQDAEHVAVVVGEASAAVQQAVAYERMLDAKVGVVHARVLLPWSHALFANAVPTTTQRIAVLEHVSTSAFVFQRASILTQNVQVFALSAHWQGAVTPQVVTGVYGGAFGRTTFTVGMARAVFDRLAGAGLTRRPFVVAKSEALYEESLLQTPTFPQLDVVFGDEHEPAHDDAYTKQFLFWGDANLEQQLSQTLGLLTKNPATQVHTVVNYSTSSVTGHPLATAEVLLSRHGAAAQAQAVEQADVVVVTNAALLAEFDVASSVKTGGRLLVFAPWKTIDDVEESTQFKATLARKNVELLAVDLEELSSRVDDAQVVAAGSTIAFQRAFGLYDERIVVALLRRPLPAEKHSMLRAFAEGVWGSVTPIVYPVEDWKQLDNAAIEVVVEGTEPEQPAAPLPTLEAFTPSKLSFASPELKGIKRSRASASKETKFAWQLLFPDAFETRQDVREHVTSLVTVTKWERLTPEHYSRNVFHIEMDITNTKIKYSIGEALAVFAHNDEKDVIDFLRSYNVDPEALVVLPVAHKVSGKRAPGTPAPAPLDETLTYFQLFAQVLDIFGRPSKKFYEALAERATDAKEKETLDFLLSPEGKDAYKERVDETVTFADLLAEFVSARPSMDDLVKLVPRIKARHYSIASSMKMNPHSVHLLIVVHDWTTPSGKHRVGQATRFLRTVRPGQQLSVSVCSSVMKLPTNHADPVIMAGLGTGMAPFRAFIQERAFLKAQGVKVGPMALYFGSRNRANEFLYGDELEEYERDGLLTYLRCAFSRDQEHKVYIQDKIAEDKELLADLLLNKNGHFYLCGPTWPVADVREALIRSFGVGGLDRKQANATIELMRAQGRYVLEVY
ncbi:TPA: hypothetical protein N0F65_007108 [Lagenidium giganteum]|uniref:FAD-binding FR-type domain-containing protein n=1 Tax=Lagenidium giganteum TaxID=4803 RepID=A0AAV2YM64_9STRA|nr:TPA: hypothetical protein N0F65_007108 [Lagenidium giganteum]